MQTVMVLEEDGDGEPTIWAVTEYDHEPGSSFALDEPVCVLRRCDLPKDARLFWPVIVARLVELEEEATGRAAGRALTSINHGPDGMPL